MTTENDEPAIDNDALLVLAISIVVMTASLGMFLWLLFSFVIYRAKASDCETRIPGSYLVFGKKLINHAIDQDFQIRLVRLCQLPKRLTLLMGGKTGDQNQSEAQAGANYLLAHGYPNDLLQLEESSRTTLENLKQARLLLALQPNQTAIFISNRYHLARCSVLANSLGMEHALCAAETAFSLDLCSLIKCIREAFFLHWFFTGKYWAILTRNQRMLDKIT